MKFSLKIMLLALLCVSWFGNEARAGVSFEINEQTRVELGLWTQVWMQSVENGKGEGEDLNDFMVRRAYFYVKGQVTPHFGFFTHIAADRIGQEGLDNPSMGLGSGAAFRDLWITWQPSEAFKVQAGRMYIPLTRNYGTTSTKTLLTTDLSPLQGGVRGSIFYAGKVGRDDGIVLWGNPADGRLQYRLMVAEGMENDSNPEDSLRFAGRLSLSLLEPEKGWFNKGTYLGEKKVLSLGFGYDSQEKLILGGEENQDNRVWTVDAFFDHPVGQGAVTLEAAYIDIGNCTQTHNITELAAGDDAVDWYLQCGYLLPVEIGPGKIQPYLRYETLDVDLREGTDFSEAGINYYIKGHNAKITAGYTNVDRDGGEDFYILTVQLAVGF